MDAAAELPVRMFQTPETAFAWAQEVVSRPQVRASCGKNHDLVMGGYGSKTGPHGADDYYDLAATICRRLTPDEDKSAAKRYDMAAFWSAYFMEEDGERQYSLGCEVGERVMRELGAEYEQIEQVARYAVRRVIKRSSGKPQAARVPKEGYAWELGLSSTSSIYRAPWRAVIDACEREFANAVHRGRQIASVELKDLGVL